MATAFLQRRFNESFSFWMRLLKRDRAVNGPIHLNRRRVYILPTRAGLLFIFVLLAMLLGAINYNNSLAYALTFLLASLTVVSILHTFRNQHGLIFHAGHPSEVFAGSSVRFPIAIENQQSDRYAVAVQFDHYDPVICDIRQGEMHWLDLHLASQQRGWLALPRITVSTIYPLGLFRAWSYLHFATRALIYPFPGGELPLPVAESEGHTSNGALGQGSDDFAHLRPYHPGDSLRHVHWKAYAREAGLLVKQFGATRSPELWLSWYEVNTRNSEARLSQLCRWVIDAETMGLTYGLVLPNQRISPARGDAHRRHCLEQLALFGSEI